MFRRVTANPTHPMDTLVMEKIARRFNFNPIVAGTVGGGLAGGALGYTREPSKEDNGSRLKNTLTGAVFGSLLGNVAGSGYQARKNYKNFYRESSGGYGRSSSGFGGSSSNPSAWQSFGMDPSKVKTKAEVNKFYKEQARKHHPDMGGDAEKMKTLTNLMDQIKKSREFEKLAFLKNTNIFL